MALVDFLFRCSVRMMFRNGRTVRDIYDELDKVIEEKAREDKEFWGWNAP